MLHPVFTKWDIGSNLMELIPIAPKLPYEISDQKVYLSHTHTHTHKHSISLYLSLSLSISLYLRTASYTISLFQTF